MFLLRPDHKLVLNPSIYFHPSRRPVADLANQAMPYLAHAHTSFVECHCQLSGIGSNRRLAQDPPEIAIGSHIGQSQLRNALSSLLTPGVIAYASLSIRYTNNTLARGLPLRSRQLAATARYRSWLALC